MEPSITLAVRVVAPNGTPVNAFTVAAGPGKLPAGSDSVRHVVRGRDGRASLGLSKEGTTWVGVAAPGFAAWEGWVPLTRGGEPLEVRLAPGVAVSGKVVVSDVIRDRIKPRLCAPSRQVGNRWLVRRAPGRGAHDPRGDPFGGRHVAVRARSARPLFAQDRRQGPTRDSPGLKLPGPRLDLGTVRIDAPRHRPAELRGTCGIRSPKAGACGDSPRATWGNIPLSGIDDEDGSIWFLADENGRFKVDDVPAGPTTVGFPYQVFDMIKAHAWTALVVEGQTTEVRAFDPEGTGEFTLAFAIGDG